jgi:hypothetical protein
MDTSGKTIVRLIPPKTHEEKIRLWDEILHGRMRQFETIAKYLENKMHVEEIAYLFSAEIETGICPQCKKQWKEIKFENQFGYVRFFEPTCECYPQCPRCKEHLYFELLAGSLKRANTNDLVCTKCQWHLVKDGVKRHGSVYEKTRYDYDRREMMRESAQSRRASRGKGY